MAREPHVPLFLRIATELLVHLTGGESAERAARVLGERLDVQRFADSVRRHVAASSRPMEVALIDDTVVPEERDAENPAEDDLADEHADTSKDLHEEKTAKHEPLKPNEK